MTFGLPNPTFCFRLCVRLQEFLMSGRLIWSLNSCKVVLFKCLGCYRQMLSSRAINFVSAHAAPTACRSGVATAGGRGGKPWTFGFGSPATRTGSTRHVRAGPARQEQSRPQPASPPHLSPFLVPEAEARAKPQPQPNLLRPNQSSHYRRGDPWSGQRCDAMMRPAKGPG